MKQRAARSAYGTVGVLVALTVWHVAAMTGVFGRALPGVDATGRSLLELLAEAATWEALVVTLVMAFAGFAAALGAGVVLGIAVARFPVFRAATRGLLEFLKPIPPIVVLPVFIVLLGPTSTMGFWLVAFGLAIQILMQTAAGALDTDPVAVDSARSYGLGRWRILVEIVLPSAKPAIATAVRIAVPGALIVSVVAGLFGGAPGLGLTILRASQVSATTDVFALIVILGVLGLLLQGLVEWSERRLIPWHPSQRRKASA